MPGPAGRGRRRDGPSPPRGRAARRPAPTRCTSWPAPTAGSAPGRFPTVAVPGRPWRTSGTGGWLAGFWPGRLWLAYQADGRPGWARRAVAAGRRRSPYGRTTPPPTTSASCCRPASARGAALAGRRRRRRVVVRRAAAALATRYVPSVRRAPQLGRAARPGHRQRRQPDEPRAALPGRPTSAVRRSGAPRGAARAHRGALAGTARRQHLPRRPVRRAPAVSRSGRGTVQGLVRRLDLGARPGLGGARLHHGVPRVARPAAARRGAPDGRLRGDARCPPTACRGGTTTRPAPGGTPRRPRCWRPACWSWPGSTPTPTVGRRWRAAGLRTLRSLVGPRYLAPRHRRVVGAAARPARPDVRRRGRDVRRPLPARGPAPGRAAARRPRPALRPVDAVRRGRRRRAPRRPRHRRSRSAPCRCAGGTGPRRRPGSSSRPRRDGRPLGHGPRRCQQRAQRGLETYDLRDRAARYVRVRPLGPTDGSTGRALRLVVRG